MIVGNLNLSDTPGPAKQILRVTHVDTDADGAVSVS